MSGQSEPSTSQSTQPGRDEVTKGQRDICPFAQCERPSHHASKMATPASCAREFPTKLHADRDKLFCTSCNVVLNL
ncbi:CGG triplet repeat-binding protein 1-like [Chelydra serpentina]|uniref:CGG triplet repeat-binding protein 1-like n=1 Tax=Chelydra serpentina TaxID=8475 RepID=A0A8T1SKD9_CHESE|nr:CGG triplet repeat-binding protein 1-like [Chelydra serpentina]